MIFKALVSSSLRRTFARQYSSLHNDNHAQIERSCKLWKNISLFICLPVCVFSLLKLYQEQTHHEHVRPEFTPYEHLRIRRKPFPWGDGNHSLFHNPKVNPLPDGYEED